MSTYTPSRLKSPSRYSRVDWFKIGTYVLAGVFVFGLANIPTLTEPINWLLLIIFVGVLLGHYRQLTGG